MGKSDHPDTMKTVFRKTGEKIGSKGPLGREIEEKGVSKQFLEPVRNDLINYVLLALVVLGLPPLITILLRAANTSRLSSFIPHIVCYSAALIVFLLRRRLSFRVRAGMLLGILFTVGTAGMLASGLVGSGSYYLFIFCVLATLLFGVRFGLITLLVSLADMIILGLSRHLREGSLDFDIVAYTTDPLAWGTRIFVFGAYSAIIIIFLHRLYRALIESMDARDRTACQLRHSREEIRNFTSHIQETIEEDRKRIARELHDELGQSLTSLRMELAALKGPLQDGQAPISKKIGSMLEILSRTVASLGRICTELRPSVLDELGLAAAIDWLAEDFQDRTGIQVIVFIRPPDIFADAPLSIAVFRIAQEALTNVARHAGAEQVKINLELENSDLILRVHDNGRGIQQKELDKSKAFGILGIQERIAILGGRFNIQGDSETGTQLRVRLPFKNGKKI